MRVLSNAILFLAYSQLISSAAVSHPETAEIARRDVPAEGLFGRAAEFLTGELEKRRGGGGGGGRGGGGSSSSGSSGSSGSSSGSGARGGGSSGSPSSGTGSSSAGGRTSGTRGFGGGAYYGGGATSPFRAGRRSPRGISPFLLPLTAAALIFPGIWLYGAYSYNYNRPYYFRNTSNTNSSNPNGLTTRLPVTCLCDKYSDCGCDDNDNSTFLTSILPNGTTGANLDPKVARVSIVNGTRTLVLNGTLANGTTAPDATTASAGMKNIVLEHAGYWVVGALVYAMVWAL